MSNISMSDYEPTVYLAGPVQHADDGGAGWRDDVIAQYDSQFKFLNPLDKYDTDVEEVAWLQPGEQPEDYPDDVEVFHPEEIIASDKAMIDDADFVLVGLQDIVPMYGTPREHEYAHQTNTRIIVWHQEDAELPIWTIGDAEYLSPDLHDCMEYMFSVNAHDAIRNDVGEVIGRMI